MDHCIPLLYHISTHMHFITNGYKRFLSTNSSDPKQRVPLIYHVRIQTKNFNQRDLENDTGAGLEITHSTHSNCRGALCFCCGALCKVLVQVHIFLGPLTGGKMLCFGLVTSNAKSLYTVEGNQAI